MDVSPIEPDATRRAIDIVTFTTLFPNREQPRHGVFVEQRLLHLVASGRVRSRVIAPVPWFPLGHHRFGRYGAFARVPRRERRGEIDVEHPRYALIPKLGMTLAPALLAAAVGGAFRSVLRSGFEFSAIDAHYFYPDGVAAAVLGRRLDRPVVITARGTDVNLIPRHALPRRQILWAARRAARIVTVCQALKDALVDLGADSAKITVLRNGVDLDRFRPVRRDDARARLGFSGPTLLSVGHLIERKGHHIAIEALRSLPDVLLVIAGDGEMESELRRQAADLGVAGRVRFVGALTHAELTHYYSAADALVLASSREGMANVLLESLACGNPVIATDAWGTPEVVRDPAAGVLMARRDAVALVEAYHELMSRYPERDATRRFAEGFGWDATTRGQIELFSGL